MKKQVFNLQTFSFIRTIFYTCENNYDLCGPHDVGMWVPHGLKFLYGTHMGPIWA